MINVIDPMKTWLNDLEHDSIHPLLSSYAQSVFSRFPGMLLNRRRHSNNTTRDHIARPSRTLEIGLSFTGTTNSRQIWRGRIDSRLQCRHRYGVPKFPPIRIQQRIPTTFPTDVPNCGFTLGFQTGITRSSKQRLSIEALLRRRQLR
jgi:hypothetical protein